VPSFGTEFCDGYLPNSDVCTQKTTDRIFLFVVHFLPKFSLALLGVVWVVLRK